MLARKTMKPLLVLCLLVFGLTSFTGLSAQSPVANAGPDQTIYLTQTNSVTLNGSASSGDSYQWTEVSTDYNSGATITSPNSAVTTVTGLPQGVFYFQLAVTNGGSTATDVVVVRVDYDVAPSNGTLFQQFDMAGAANTINLRDDTTSYFPVSDYTHSQYGTFPNELLFFRDRLNGLRVDDPKGKLYSTIQDGYGAEVGSYGNYARSEICNWRPSLDTNKTYVFEWKGYLPQNVNYIPAGASNQALAIFQVHGNIQVATVFSLRLAGDGTIKANEVINSNNGQVTSTTIGNMADFYSKTHTIRVTFREGSNYSGQKAFVKIEIDGVQKYFRNTGSVGSFNDYIKFAGIYDVQRLIVNPDLLSRGRKFSLVTESFKVYLLGDNASPIANAGSDQTITLPTNSVHLSGSGKDSDGSISSYQWTKISGPSDPTIGDSNSASTTVSNLIQGVYEFQLKVTDNDGATAKNTVQITVNAAKNIAPTADAGTDKTITLPTNSVTLSGRGNDSDGTITSYLWTKISGPTATIANPSSETTNVTGLLEGTYQFELKVTDDKGATGKDTVNITVNAAKNIAPTADAGTDKTITLPTNTVTLSGSGNDSDGAITSYAWAKISGPTATIISASSATTNVTGLVQGSYQFELKVTDDKGSVGTDTVQIIVNPTVNIAPTANAGADQTITLPTNTVTLNGSGTDSDGTIASYSWTKTAGPSAGTISNASSATTTITSLIAGEYTFNLKVTDNQGATGTDTVHVTVKNDTTTTIQVAKQNIAPTANAGADQTITLPTNTVTLNGSATDSDGTIASYSWTKTAGPSAGTISNASSATTTITSLIAGEYTFNLKVTDNQDATGTDTVHVTVKNDTTTTIQVVKQNIAPTANAGADQTITLPTNSIILSGTGTDADGTIASYSWTKVSGPSTFSIGNSSSSTVNISNLVAGTYQFELKVTDDKGAIGKDTVQVTVISNTTLSQPVKQNIAPIANAGADQTIALPTSSVTLTGSGNDSDGTIAAYQWTEISGPSATITAASSATTTIKGLVQGTYQFELKVTDDKGAIGKDTVQITVNNSSSPVNIAPTANAGSDITTVSSVQSVTITGSGTDPDGKIKSYSWSEISGPSTATISGSNSATIKVRNLIEGTYQFELKVTDDKGATGRDTVNVTVALERTSSTSTSNVTVKTTSLKVYPNPVHDVATVEITAPSTNTNIMIVITDINGKTVYTDQFVSTSTYVQKQINMSSLIKGTYFISVYFDGMQQQTVKVMRL
jgi:major membrane immunogen (membrane-anchored lipoprotein)